MAPARELLDIDTLCADGGWPALDSSPAETVSWIAGKADLIKVSWSVGAEFWLVLASRSSAKQTISYTAYVHAAAPSTTYKPQRSSSS